MNTHGLNLLISDKADAERESLVDVFASMGGTVHRLGRFWDPPDLDPRTVRVYGAETFCRVLEQKLTLALISPPDELILAVPQSLLSRHLARLPLVDVLTGAFPVFVKPIVPKQFRGAVYANAEELEGECRGLPSDTPLLVSERVCFTCEVRAFVLHGRVLDAAFYEGSGDLDAAKVFVTTVGAAVQLPEAVVIDVGYVDGRGWALIEFNAAWGAGLNGCDPEKVLPAIIEASGGALQP